VERRQSPAWPWPEPKPVATMKSALGAFLKASGLQGAMKHPQLDSAWGRIVGPEFAPHTRVLGFRKGIVAIGVDSSALMNEIRFHRTALLGDLQREIRRPAITGISFSLIPAQECDDGPPET
jgi:predicted nucleic acid-binding Zn ribbon protein